MTRLIYKNKGQSILEYSILIIIILAVLLTMNTYIKRAVQGRWKASVDEMGDQYDPRTANSLVNYSTNSSSNTFIDIVPAANGASWTKRVDTSSATENKVVQITVGSQ